MRSRFLMPDDELKQREERFLKLIKKEVEGTLTKGETIELNSLRQREKADARLIMSYEKPNRNRKRERP